MFRRNTARVIVILLIGILMFAVVVGCGGHPLVGTWEAYGGLARWAFLSNGTVHTYYIRDDTWDRVRTGTWHTDGNRLTTTGLTIHESVDFSISGRTLTITEERMWGPLTLTRVR